jgi:2-dehydropantoate 2-reductase
MKIAIVGAGAIGCYLGGRLTEHGHDVRFLARARSKEELTTHGVTVIGLDDARRFSIAPKDLEVTLEPAALADCDAILVCVKSGQTAAVAASIAPHVRENAVVVSMQNGVRNADVIREHVANAATVLGGIVGFNVVAEGSGIFRQGTSGALVIEDAPAARALGAALGAEMRADIRAVQWSKLVMNLNNAIGALTDVPTPTLIFDPGYRRVLAAVMGEAIRVIRAAGIRPARLGAIPVRYFPLMLRLPTRVLRVVARAQLEMDPTARSSMWQDLHARRTTEIDELNGEIVRLAEKNGMRAPVNAAVVRLIRDAERANAGSPALSADALWNELNPSRARSSD